MTRHKGIVERRPELTAGEKRRISRRIDRLFSKEQWADVEKTLKDALVRSPEDHWLLVRLADAAYERRRYKTALRLYRKAETLAPGCPLVLWGLAGASAASGDVVGGKRRFQSIARMKPEVLGTRQCGEGISWARGLIADAHFRLGQFAEREGAKAVARRRYQTYLRWTERPALSTESRKEARARLKALDGASIRTA